MHEIELEEILLKIICFIAWSPVISAFIYKKFMSFDVDMDCRMKNVFMVKDNLFYIFMFFLLNRF